MVKQMKKILAPISLIMFLVIIFLSSGKLLLPFDLVVEERISFGSFKSSNSSPRFEMY